MNATETDVNASVDEPGTGELRGCTALMIACKHCHSNMVLALLERGADPNKQDRKGRRAVHYVAQLGQEQQQQGEEMLRALFKADCDMQAKDKSGENALHHAARAGLPSICRLVLQFAKQSNPDTCLLDAQSIGKGDTPLILAACWGHTECDCALREAGADADLTTRNGWDAVRWAQWFERSAKDKGAKKKEKKKKKNEKQKQPQPNAVPSTDTNKQTKQATHGNTPEMVVEQQEQTLAAVGQPRVGQQ
jgi:ankyrin repeat protein